MEEPGSAYGSVPSASGGQTTPGEASHIAWGTNRSRWYEAQTTFAETTD